MPVECSKAEDLGRRRFFADSASGTVAGEAELVAAAQRGEERALEALYRSHYERIYRYVLFRVGDRAAAEDVTAQVFLAMVRGVSQYEHRDRPFLAWLYGISRKQVAVHFREASRRNGDCHDTGGAEAESDGAHGDVWGPEHDYERREQNAKLALALRALPEAQREIVLLRSLLDLSIEQTAQITGKSRGAVKQLHRRALDSLRVRLAHLLPR
jgi:RNA polymerase sigma-70 factor, ECF subfamily